MIKKIQLDYDNTLIDSYISSLQKQLPMYDVNVNNANDFQKMLDEKQNCRNCNCLNDCKNEQRGHYQDYLESTFVLKECKYLKDLKIKQNENDLIKTLYLPQSILEADLALYDTNCESRKKIYNMAVDFINNFKSGKKGRGLYLYGSYSIGKTYTLAMIANELKRNNIKSLIIYFPDLVVDLKQAISTPRLEQLINMLKSVDVLMLDDLGSENMTPWLRDEVLGPVINYRVLENKPMFISSNIAPNELKQYLAIDKTPQGIMKAERIISRLIALVQSINMDDSNKYSRNLTF